MQLLTVYDIRTSNDLVSDEMLAFILVVLATFGIGCAAASIRRPCGTRGRIAIAAILSGFAATLMAASLVFVAAAAECREHRGDLVAGRFTLLRGEVTALRRVQSRGRSDWEFELGSHWFVAPNQACPQHPGDRVALAYLPANTSRLADIILRLQTNQQCKRF